MFVPYPICNTQIFICINNKHADLMFAPSFGVTLLAGKKKDKEFQIFFSSTRFIKSAKNYKKKNHQCTTTVSSSVSHTCTFKNSSKKKTRVIFKISLTN